MEPTKNHIRLELFSEKVENGHHEKLAVIKLNLASGVNVITPELVIGDPTSNEKIDKKSIYGFNAQIHCDERNTLVIKDFPYFTLASYSNTESVLAHLKVYNSNNFFRLNNLQIRRIDSEFSNALIVNCEVDEIYVGIESWHQDRANQSKKILNDEVETDIRSSRIGKVKTYIKQKKINIQDSIISELQINEDIKDMYLWQGASVARFSIGKTIDKLKIDDSIVEIIQGQKNSIVRDFHANNSSFVKVFELYENNVLSSNSASLELISESYRNSRNKEKQYEYLYLYQKELTNKIPRKINRVFPRLLELTCGSPEFRS